jgi:DNA modification methylase
MLGDFREKCKDIPDNSIDLVFTDPPYTKECISLYKDLAEIAFRKLRKVAALLRILSSYHYEKYMIISSHLE